jgi:hypothetical protein
MTVQNRHRRLWRFLQDRHVRSSTTPRFWRWFFRHKIVTNQPLWRFCDEFWASEINTFLVVPGTTRNPHPLIVPLPNIQLLAAAAFYPSPGSGHGQKEIFSTYAANMSQVPLSWLKRDLQHSLPTSFCSGLVSHDRSHVNAVVGGEYQGTEVMARAQTVLCRLDGVHHRRRQRESRYRGDGRPCVM